VPARSPNVQLQPGHVSPLQRALRNGHFGRVIWLTGLPAAGKSTIAAGLESALFNQGLQVCRLDGDNLRHGLCADLAFSPADRRENIRRVAEVARLLADSGLIVITALVSPLAADREMARRIVGPAQFVEVYVNAPLAVCEERDPKGLYARARANLIQEFTGVSAPYQPPADPDLELRTAASSPSAGIALVMDYLIQLEKTALTA
jgi:adenylyl-sulfate kinase